MTDELGIVIGTSRTSIYVAGNGVVLDEPTLISFNGNHKSRKVKAVGEEALTMLGKLPENITMVHPVRDGVVSDAEATRSMLSAFLRKIFPPKTFPNKKRAIVGLPLGLTLGERRAYDSIFSSIGLHDVIFVENVMLNAVGIDLPVHLHKIFLIVNIGAGVTEVAAISLGGIVKGCSVSVGGNMMDRALRDYVLGKYDVELGLNAVTEVKEKIGSLYTNDTSKMQTHGTDIKTHVPTDVIVRATDVMDALLPYYLRIADAVSSIITSLSPEAAEDILTDGLHVVGGGSKIAGLEKLFTDKLNCVINVHEDGEYATVLGAGKLLSNAVLLNEIVSQQ